MKRLARLTLWTGIAGLLTVGVAPAQLLNEIIRGSINDVTVDIFNCNDPMACGITYRMYSSVDSSEINGPANPVDGIPRYNRKFDRYQSDAQTTANYPASSAGLDNNDWYVVWDATTDGGTGDHLGWYGAQSQKIFFGEIGNSFSFNCLPVIAQEACFGALSDASSHGTVRNDGTPVDPIGGLSPVPVPSLDENALSSVSYSWGVASNSTTRDGAGSAVAGYSLYLVGCPEGAPTDADLASDGVRVASVPFGTNGVTLDRGTLNATPGLEGAATYAAAVKLDYASSGPSLQSNFSGNSANSGVCVTDFEPGDAPAFIDIETICYEIRTDGFGNRFFVVTFKMAQTPVAVSQRKYELDLGTVNADLIALPSSAARNKSGQDFLTRATANFDAGDIVGNSSIDNLNGVVTLVVNADGLQASQGTTFRLAGRAKQPGNRDEFDLGIIDLSTLE